MINIPKWIIVQKLNVSLRKTLFLGYNSKDIEKKIFRLKFINTRDFLRENVAFLKSEYRKIKEVNFSNILKIHDILELPEGLVIIEEELKSFVSLEEYLKTKALDIKTFLSIALQICESIQNLHSINLIHRNISLSTILIDKETDKIKLSEIGTSIILNQEKEYIYEQEIIKKKLPFISPEQTGRMNRPLDYRTDFYSLGIVLYYMLTKNLPFESSDPLEIVHFHIAGAPEPPDEKEKNIPAVISKIVMKLLSKASENRYQSALGLKNDLKKCINQLESKGAIEDFQIGLNDISDKLIIPDTLYGREEEIEAIMEVFNRVCLGTSEMLFISGVPGIGKTSLVNELKIPITANRGYFIFGKFDQLNMNKPYSAIISAFGELIRTLLVESEERLEMWKDEILKAAGNNGKIITDVIPEVELIIGRQPEVPELEPLMTKNRFNLTFQKFVNVFAKEEHPLVLFLDDLQWIDTPSLNLIEMIVSMPDIENFLFIGAYRSNEVNEFHKFMISINELKKKNITINNISLHELQIPHISKFLTDTFHTNTKDEESLVQLIYNKTEGNPFFIKQFLIRMYEEHIVKYSSDHVWRWDLDKIQKMQIADNVVDMMMIRINRLLPEAQDILKKASCIGNTFSLETLISISGKTATAIFSIIFELLTEGFIYEADKTYHFIHDKIQEAAYGLIPEEEKLKIHYKIGKSIFSSAVEADKFNEEIFSITDQLNMSAKLIKDKEEYYELAKLNLSSGKKARLSTAFEAAYKYFKKGMEFVENDVWEKNYKFAIELHEGLAEASYLCGFYEESDKIIDIVVKNAKDAVDKVKCYTIRIQAYFSQGRHDKVLKAAIEILSEMGLNINKNPGKIKLIAAYLWTSIYYFKFYSKKTMESLRNLPEIEDPKKDAIIWIACIISPLIYSIAPLLIPYIFLKAMIISIKYGKNCYLPNIIVGYGFTLLGFLNRINLGYNIAEIGINMVDKYNYCLHKATVIFNFNILVNHTKKHIRETLNPLIASYQSGIETGDFDFGFRALGLYCRHLFLSGENLAKVEKISLTNIKILYQFKQFSIYNYNLSFNQIVLTLVKDSIHPLIIENEMLADDKIKFFLDRGNDKVGIYIIYFSRFFLYYYFNDYQNALINIDKGKQYKITGVYYYNIIFTYDSLIRLAVYGTAPEGQKKEILKIVKRNQKIIKEFAKHGPANYLHKWYLVEAEKANVLYRDKKAEVYYMQAINYANENDYIYEEALGHELFGAYFLKRNNKLAAKTHLANAYKCYEQWGATAKLLQLNEKYPEFLNFSAEKKDLEEKPSTLDIAAIVKASQAISTEIEKKKLLDKLMNIAVENAGAQTGYLILVHGKNNLYAEACWKISGKNENLFKAGNIDSMQSMPVSLIKYVYKTKEAVILKNALEKGGKFSLDEYIKEQRVKSVLCMPIIMQKEITGIIYLENNLVENAFTQENVKILNLLSAQAAISIKNSILYDELRKLNEELENRVKDRTSKLSAANEELKKEIDERTKAEQEKEILQEKLIESEKMSAVGQLAAGIAHEINNPMEVIMGFSQSTMKDLKESDKLYMALSSIYRESIRCKRLIEDLLTFSSFINEAFKIKTDMNSLFKKFMASIEEKAQKQKIKIILKENKENLYAVVNADQIEKVLDSLCNNAMEAMINGGELTAEISLNIKNEVEISIKDTGTGIQESLNKKIFEPFFSTKETGSHTGIGLSLCYEILKKHNGTIDFESESQKGSTFTIKIPSC